MTIDEAKQIIQNFPNWNADDKWLDNAEMEELVKVLDNALENAIERLSESYNKAIEDMVSSLIRNSSTEAINGKICLIVTEKRIRLVAEQLKKGDTDE